MDTTLVRTSKQVKIISYGNAPKPAVGPCRTQYGCCSRRWLGVVSSPASLLAGCFAEFSFLSCPSCFTQYLVFLGILFPPALRSSLPFPPHFFLPICVFFLLTLVYSTLHVVWCAGSHTFRPGIHCVRHCMAKSPVLAMCISVL